MRLAAPMLALLLLGCSPEPGPTAPSADTVQLVCAEDYDSGSRIAFCDAVLCTSYIASARGWVEEWTGQLAGECLELGPGDELVGL